VGCQKTLLILFDPGHLIFKNCIALLILNPFLRHIAYFSNPFIACAVIIYKGVVDN
jgi:hypothetical protein